MNAKQIEGYGDYTVSCDGAVFSNKTNKFLKLTLSKGGYLALSLCIDGKATRHYVHRLVAIHFVSKPPFESAYVNHMDGNKLNNHYSNLEWTTREENLRHAGRIGLMKSGENHHGCKLSDVQIAEIRQLIASRAMKQSDIAKKFGCGESQISRIKHGIQRNKLTHSK